MEVLSNGDYKLSDGRIVKAADIGKLYEKSGKKGKPENELNLEEGQCSGQILLED